MQPLGEQGRQSPFARKTEAQAPMELTQGPQQLESVTPPGTDGPRVRQGLPREGTWRPEAQNWQGLKTSFCTAGWGLGQPPRLPSLLLGVRMHVSPLPSNTAQQKLPHVGPHPTWARGLAAWSVGYGMGGMPFPEGAPPGGLWPVTASGAWGAASEPPPHSAPPASAGWGVSSHGGFGGPGLPSCRH